MPAAAWPRPPRRPRTGRPKSRRPTCKLPAGGVTTAAATATPNAPSGVVPVHAEAGPAKAKAAALVGEGKALQSSGRYLEARGKYVEAQKCNAEFGPTEASPDMCLIELASAVMKQIDAAIREAQVGATTPDKMRECEAKLKSSQELAIGFGLDTQPIQAHMMLLASASGQPTMPAARPTPSADGMVQGQTMLEKARMELKRGQCDTARQLATEVYNGPFGHAERSRGPAPLHRRRGTQPAGPGRQPQLRRGDGRLPQQGLRPGARHLPPGRREPACRRTRSRR